ncbi:MAG: HAMP domain-containing histidine kinase [Lachnospiraceae bacterium]|nr:HAMP domain-containing histidine kinase [Lachnospiraceae bacterium]
MDKRVQYEVSRAFLKRFLFHMVLYILFILVMAETSWFYCNSRIWYGNEPFYKLIHFMHKNFMSVFLLVICSGAVIIACLHFFWIASMLGRVTQETGRLYSGITETAKLPPQLKEMENQLNFIMSNVRKSRQEASEAIQRKNDMIVYMAHDLKTPLTSVIGYITLVKDEDGLPDAIRKKYLDVAMKKAERLEDLVNEFFEVARYNFTQMVLEYSTVNLTIMIEQILYEFKPVFDKKGLSYNTELDTDIVVVCDIEKIERVFDNLFRNVVNYSYENTEIKVSLKDSGKDGIKFIIENCGRTIPKEKIACIFDRFFRIDNSRSTETGGAGLGLAIVKEITSLHGWTVNCESENEKIRFIINIEKEQGKKK